MRFSALVCALGLTAAIGAGAQAQSISCGGSYTIERGDSLQKVTRMAYGEGLSWSYLYNINKDVVGPNPSLIEIGMVLQVPCRDGQTPSATRASAPAASTAAAAAPAAAPARTGEIASASARRPVLRLVTASDYAPFHDQNDPNGGMVTEIADVALAQVVQPGGYRIDFINDWSAHLDPLISDMAYDFALSWFRPNCDVIEKLGPGSQFRCNNLAWSDPLFEQIIAYYMRADDANKPAAHQGLFGRTLCRPAGYSVFMMEEKDLVEPNIKFVSPSGPSGCFEMLMSGEADAVVLGSMAADDAIGRMGIADQVEEQPQLATIATLHAVTSINNPNKEEQIALFNSGVQKLRESGKWFEIVQRHLIKHARVTAQQ